MGDDLAIPVPDPTILTTAALARAVSAERDYVDGLIGIVNERLRGIDRATELLNETVNRVPTDVTNEVTHLRELMDERLRSVDTQFKERDIRSEREARDNKVAVDAAFAASKEASSEQNKSNTLAISKSETATTETINKLAELFKTTTDALSDKHDDLKERVGRIESARIGAVEQREEGRAQMSTSTAVIGAAVAVALFLLTLYALTKGSPGG